MTLTNKLGLSLNEIIFTKFLHIILRTYVTVCCYLFLTSLFGLSKCQSLSNLPITIYVFSGVRRLHQNEKEHRNTFQRVMKNTS